MNEAGYVVCATCGDYAVDFNAVMLDCSTCENSYHHTCVGMDLSELGRRMSSTNAMRKSKGKGKNGEGDVTGTLYDWMCPDCMQQQQPRVPEPAKDKEEVLVIEDTDDDEEDDGERTTYIDLSYNIDLHRVAPSQRALLPTTTARRTAVNMQNVAGLLGRTNVGASTSRASNIDASTSTSKPVPASTSTSASPTSHNAAPPTTGTSATTRNVQTPLSPPPSRSPSRTGPIAPVPFVDFTAMATSSKKRRRSSEEGEGRLEDERAKKKSRVAGPPAALLRTPVEPIDLTLSDDEVLVTPAAPSTSRRDAASMSSRRDAASVSSVGSRPRSRHGPGSVSSGTTDIATEDEPVPTRNLMRASLAGRTPRVPLPLVSSAASSSTTRPAASSSTPRPAPASSTSRSTIPSKRRLSASPSNSNSHAAPVKRPVVQNQEQEDDDDEEHAFFRSRRTAGGGLTRTRSDAAILPASTSTAVANSTVPTRTRSDGALPPAGGTVNRKTTTANWHVSDEEHAGSARRPVLASATSTSTSTSTTTTTTRTQPSSSRPLASEPRAARAVVDTPLPKKKIVAVHDVDDLPDYISDEEHEREPESTALPAASRVSSASALPAVPEPAARLSSSRAPPTTSSSARPTPTTTTTTSTSTTTTAFRQPALPPPRAAAPVPSAAPTAPIPSTAPVPSTVPAPSNARVPVPTSTSSSQSQPLFLPDSPSPSPERRDRESQSQRLMSLPPISFLDEADVDVEDEYGARKDVDVGVDELEDELDEDGPSESGTIRKRKTAKTKENGKKPARPAPAMDDAVVNTTERRKETSTQEGGRSYAQQVVDKRLENVSAAGLASLLDSTRAGEGDASVKVKKHRDRDRGPALGLSASASLEKTKHAVLDTGAGESSTSGSVKEKKSKHRHLDADVGEGESSTSGSVKEKKKKHRDWDRDAVDLPARPALGLSAPPERKMKHADAGEGESSTSGSMKEKKKKHRDRDPDAVDAPARPAEDVSGPLGKKNTHRHLGADAGADVGEGESSTSGSVKVKKKKHRDGDAGAVDSLAVPSLGLSTSASLEKKNKRKHISADASVDGGEGESSTSSSVKKKKHRDAAQGVVDAPAVPSKKTPRFQEPATPDRRVGDLTVSWNRLQELASFSPSSAKKTTTTTQADVDSFRPTVREEGSSRQVGRKTARPPPLPTLNKSSAVSSSSTGHPIAAMSAARVPDARFPAAASTAPASSSTASAATSRPDAENEKQKEKQPMQMQRARKTVFRRDDRDDAPVQAREPAPSSSTSALPERTKAAAPDRADDHDAPAKGKSTLDKYSARAVASSSSTVLPPSTSTSTLPPVVASSSRPKPNPSAAVLDLSKSRPSAPSTAPSSSRSKHRVADPSLPFEAPVVPRRKAIAGVDYPLPDIPLSPAKAKPDKKATARKVPRTALVSDEETPMEVDVDARVHTSRKGKEKEHAITVDDDSPPQPKEKARPESRPKPPPIPRLRSASIWSSSTPTPAPYTTSSPSLDAVTAFLKKRRMANPLPSSSTLPSAPTQGQKMAATKRRLERGEHESDLPVPMSVLANAREMQTLRRLVKRSVVVEKPEYRVGEVKSDVVMPFDWAKYRAESERKEKERDEQGVEAFDAT